MKIEYIVVHCSATKPSMNWTVTDIDREHRKRGFLKVGYHYVIRRDGLIEPGRDESEPGAHEPAVNRKSLGICLVGGLAADGKTPEDNFTPEQYDSLNALLHSLTGKYPDAKVCGHRDLSPDLNGDGVITRNEWKKHCPCFDVREWWSTVR